MTPEPIDQHTPEYIYEGFEIDEVPPEEFAAGIQQEVELIGGCVTTSIWEGPPNAGMARVIVAFPGRKDLEVYIRRYYSEGDLDPETIEQEVASIREI
jgi:hypothetical protein